MNLDLYELRTPHLIMRPLPTSYAGKLLTFFNENREFLEPWEPTRSADFYTLRYMHDYLRYELDELREGTGIRFWLFERNDTHLSRIVGGIALNDIVWGSYRSGIVGYRMHNEFAGKGYMTEALCRLRQFAFEQLSLHRMEVCIIPRNMRSIRVVEKLGFSYEGCSKKYMKINGVWEDHNHYVSLNEPENVRLSNLIDAKYLGSDDDINLYKAYDEVI